MVDFSVYLDRFFHLKFVNFVEFGNAGAQERVFGNVNFKSRADPPAEFYEYRVYTCPVHTSATFENTNLIQSVKPVVGIFIDIQHGFRQGNIIVAFSDHFPVKTCHLHGITGVIGRNLFHGQGNQIGSIRRGNHDRRKGGGNKIKRYFHVFIQILQVFQAKSPGMVTQERYPDRVGCKGRRKFQGKIPFSVRHVANAFVDNVNRSKNQWIPCLCIYNRTRDTQNFRLFVSKHYVFVLKYVIQIAVAESFVQKAGNGFSAFPYGNNSIHVHILFAVYKKVVGLFFNLFYERSQSNAISRYGDDGILRNRQIGICGRKRKNTYGTQN